MLSQSIRLVFLLALALPLAALDSELLKLARQDANFIMGVRVADIASSPLVKTMLGEMTGPNPEVGSLLQVLGPQPLAAFEELLVVANVDSASPREPQNAVVLLRGAFDPATFSDLLCAQGCGRESYGGIELIKVERGETENPGYLAMLGPGYAALGERPAVISAIDRRSLPSSAGPNPRMQTWVSRLSRYHLWLAATGPFENKAPIDAAGGPAALAANAAAKMDGFGFGLQLDDDVSFAVELESVSDADSQQLFQTLQGFLALARMGQQAESTEVSGPASEAFDFLEHLKLNQAGRVVSASLAVPQAKLTEQLRVKLEERRQAAGEVALQMENGSERPGEAALDSPPAPSPRGQSAIRVYGIDPRPIQYPVTPR